MVTNRQDQQRLGAEVQALIESAIKRRQSVCILGVDQFAGNCHLPGNAFAERNADLLMVKARSGDRPQLFTVFIDQENRAALGFYLSPRNFENQFEKLSQIERGIQQARSFKQQRKLVDVLIFFLRGQNIVELGSTHLRVEPPP